MMSSDFWARPRLSAGREAESGFGDFCHFFFCFASRYKELTSAVAELRRGGQGTAAETQGPATRAVNSLLEVG